MTPLCVGRNSATTCARSLTMVPRRCMHASHVRRLSMAAPLSISPVPKATWNSFPDGSYKTLKGLRTRTWRNMPQPTRLNTRGWWMRWQRGSASLHSSLTRRRASSKPLDCHNATSVHIASTVLASNVWKNRLKMIIQGNAKYFLHFSYQKHHCLIFFS